MVHDGRRPGALLKPLRAAAMVASVSDVGPSASKPVLVSACVTLFAGSVSVAHPGQPVSGSGHTCPTG